MARARAKQKSPFEGLWYIVSMSGWDEDYFNEEVQAFIELEASQSASCSNWLVMVPKVRVCCRTLPLASRRRTQATTVSLWTSRPAHEAYKRSMRGLPGRPPGRQRGIEQSALRALPRREATVSGTRRCPGQTDTRAQGTKGGTGLVPGSVRGQHSGAAPIFMVAGCRAAAWRLGPEPPEQPPRPRRLRAPPAARRPARRPGAAPPPAALPHRPKGAHPPPPPAALAHPGPAEPGAAGDQGAHAGPGPPQAPDQALQVVVGAQGGV